MDLGISGKTALVAASSRGLGRAIAEELGAAGTNLLLCARGEEALHRTRDEIREKHGRDGPGIEVEAMAVDLTDSTSIRTLTDHAIGRFGGVDILVTNVGGPPAGRFEEHTPEAWDRAVRQNLMSVIDLTRGVLPGMKERGWGRILNVTSIAVKQPVENLILSNSVRAAVTGFAKTLANEVAAFGVTVNNLMPGYTRTERLTELAAKVAEQRAITVPEAFQLWEAEIPMGRIGEPEEFAALAAFLASERASYITGTSVPVDGGAIRALL